MIDKHDPFEVFLEAHAKRYEQKGARELILSSLLLYILGMVIACWYFG